MTETLGRVRMDLDLEPEENPVLSLTGIRFEGSDLSRPRYPSLIDPERAPAQVQFEPGLQIREEAVGLLTIRFEIAEPGVTFLLTPFGGVQVASVFDPWKAEVPAGVEAVTLVDGDPQKCELVWNQDAADKAGYGRLNLLRLFCQRDGQPLSAVEEVEGGVYLAILKRMEVGFAKPFCNEPGSPIPRTTKVLGFDLSGRPVYDLFMPGVQDALPSTLALEPSFRCREGQIVDFSLVLDLPDGIDLEFVTEPDGDQVEVAGFLPQGRPFQLAGTTAGSFNGYPNRMCGVSWFQETGRQYCSTSNAVEAKRCYCTQGQGSAFALRATPGGAPPFGLAPDEVVEFDPTVIQPPSCTASGICITP